MSLSNDQLQERIEAIEVQLNSIQLALNNLTTKRQMKALVNVRQSEIEDLKLRVSSLEAQIIILQ